MGKLSVHVRCAYALEQFAPAADTLPASPAHICGQVDILMAQPLRLGAMAEEGKIDLSSVRLLILDEADKLFELGFTEQAGGAAVCSCCAGVLLCRRCPAPAVFCRAAASAAALAPAAAGSAPPSCCLPAVEQRLPGLHRPSSPASATVPAHCSPCLHRRSTPSLRRAGTAGARGRCSAPPCRKLWRTWRAAC